MILDLREKSALQGRVLRHALLDEVGATNRFGESRREPDLPALARRIRQLGPGALSVRQNLAHAWLRVGMRIEDHRVETVLDEPARPASADDAAPYQRNVDRHCLDNASFWR